MKIKFKQMFQPYEGEIRFSLWNLLWPILLWAVVLFIGYTLPNLLHIPETVPGSTGTETPWIRLALALPIPVIALIILLKNSNNVLKRHWGDFRNHIWKNLALTFIIFVGIQLIAYGIFKPLLNATMGPASAITLNAGTSLFLGSLVPMTAPFSEEITVHYLISEQFTSTKLRLWIGILVSNILFSLLHVYALNFSIYMLVFYFFLGLLFHLVSLYFKNIWYNIFVHFWWNLMGALVGLGTFVVLIFS